MEKPKFYSSTVVYFTLAKPIKSKRPSSGIVIGAFPSILLLSILMKNNYKQIFQSCWLFLAEQKYDLVPLYNSKLRRRIVRDLTMIDNNWKLQLPLTAGHLSKQNSTFVAEFNSNLKNFWGPYLSI